MEVHGRFLHKNPYYYIRKKNECAESSYGRLVELTENSSRVVEDTTLIRDTFILNLLDYETQRDSGQNSNTHHYA